MSASGAAADASRVHRVLVGPTGSGKKGVAVRLAEKHGWPVLAMDSMKVYRGMDIGTDKPAAEQRARVPYRLLDLVGHDERFDAGRWLEAALQAVQASEGEVLFAGGTPLYLRLLVRGLFRGPGADAAVRAELDAMWEEQGEAGVRIRLAEVDPDLEARLLPGDRKRLLRGLEVHTLTGQPLSRLQAEQTQPPLPGRFELVALRHPPEVQRLRIEQRVEHMLERGLLDEVARLEAAAPFAPEPARSIGYAEALEHLAGRLDREAMVTAIVRRTSRLVRKQGTFLRSFKELTWIDVEPDESPEALTERVARALRAP